MRIILANGCFDLLHPGHVLHLQQAREMGSFLMVALTLDQFVNKGPGRPVYSWEHRALLLRELRCVNQIVPSSSGVDAILKCRPHIFVKGIDYQDDPEITEACEKVGAEIRKTTTPKFSTTETIRKAMA